MMRVRFRKPKSEVYSTREGAYVSPAQIFLSTTRDYEVYAVSVYDGVTFLQVVDDKDTPVFLPRVLFEVVDRSLPVDWICNVFPEGEIQLVFGPPFVATDIHSYNAMIDQAAAQVEAFWQRVEAGRDVTE